MFDAVVSVPEVSVPDASSVRVTLVTVLGLMLR